jgi:2-polyprenyl-3-methyl-5-hydroxy-6-metoxy-1,4-benzoquinol methylase
LVTAAAATAEPPRSPHFTERERCPGCGDPRHETLYRTNYLQPALWEFLRKYYAGGTIAQHWLEGAEYRLDECLGCTLAFQRYIPIPRFLDVLYDQWLNSHYHPEQDPVDRHAMKHPAATRDGHELLTLAHTVDKDVSELRVLDYGMGWGAWSRVAVRLGVREVFGFDLSTQRQQYARQHGIRTVSLEQIAGLELDFVNTEQVFEHVTTPHEDAVRLAGGLRRGGILKIAVPQAPGLRRRLAVMDWHAPRRSHNSLNPVHPLEHLNCWTPRALDALAHRVGLVAARPSVKAYLAFVGRPGALRLTSPKQVVKSLLRMPYNQLSRHNLYRWYRRP